MTVITCTTTTGSTAGSTTTGPREVLVIDDDRDLRTISSIALRLEGWTVATAPDGMTGLAMLEQTVARGEFPTVVLDVQMPDVDGWYVLAAIRAHPALAELPVLLCTVLAGPDALLHGYDLGADGFVGKPFDIGDLVAETRVVSEMSATQRAHRRAARIASLRGPG